MTIKETLSMSSSVDKEILVVGVGNPLHSDDGVGPYVIDLIEGKIPGIQTRSVQQLNLEVLEEVFSFDKVILVDAALDGKDLEFKKVEWSRRDRMVSSHVCSPGVLISLARTIYGKELDLYLCTIRGENFSLGQT